MRPFEAAPRTRYAKSGEVSIAFQVVGDGPLDLVFVMGWVSHLDYFWEEPRFAHFLRRLASFSRLILFDKRGTGLSDRVPLDALPTLEQRMDDVRAVLDAVGSERAALLGVSDGSASLSPREREVAALLSRGLSNRQMAEELAISVATVERHVANTLTKLGHRSRAQIAAWAMGQAKPRPYVAGPA